MDYAFKVFRLTHAPSADRASEENAGLKHAETGCSQNTTLLAVPVDVLGKDFPMRRALVTTSGSC
jgi:hypothetical protein